MKDKQPENKANKIVQVEANRLCMMSAMSHPCVSAKICVQDILCVQLCIPSEEMILPLIVAKSASPYPKPGKAWKQDYMTCA